MRIAWWPLSTPMTVAAEMIMKASIRIRWTMARWMQARWMIMVKTIEAVVRVMRMGMMMMLRIGKRDCGSCSSRRRLWMRILLTSNKISSKMREDHGETKLLRSPR